MPAPLFWNQAVVSPPSEIALWNPQMPNRVHSQTFPEVPVVPGLVDG